MRHRFRALIERGTLVYPLTPDDPARAVDFAGMAAAGGALLIQLRLKGLSTGEWVRIAAECVRAAGDALLIVNDRVDVAMLAGAAGVHLGQEDFPPDEARRIFPEGIIGVSTHNLVEVEATRSLDLDLIGLGPVFSSGTKPGLTATLGLQGFRELRGRSPHPVVAIGGITLEQASALRNAGACALALTADIFGSPDPASRVREYVRILGIENGEP